MCVCVRRNTAQIIIRRDFTIDTSFKSYGVICLPVTYMYYEGTCSDVLCTFLMAEPSKGPKKG